MKPLALIPILLLALGSSLSAAPIQVESKFSDLGVLRPDRLSGPQVQKDYYLPLPSRVLDEAKSEVRIEILPSPFLSPRSVVSILLNDRPVDTERIDKGGTLVLHGAIPKSTRADDPTRNILKLTIKGDLALVDASGSPSASADRAMTWIDVLPSSSFSCVFDSMAGDWLSIGRLAITLRPLVEIVAPADATPLQTDLALKLTSWAAKNSPHSQLRFSDSTTGAALSNTDRFVIEPAVEGKAPLEITSEGLDRIVHVRASTETEAEGVWNALKLAEQIPLPGQSWTSAISTAAPSAQPKKAGAFLSDLDPDSMMLNKGTGDTACTFRFNLAKLTPTPANLVLHLTGVVSPAQSGAEPTTAIFLNGQLIFSEMLTAGSKSFDFTIPLPARQLRGNNEISISMIPANGSSAIYLWQLTPDSSIQVSGPAKSRDPLGLVDAGLRFADGPYQIWLAQAADWKIAADAVTWLQRINPSHLLEPALSSELNSRSPAVVIGSLATKSPGPLSAFPVTIKDGRLCIHSSTDSAALSLSPSAGLGIWQLGELGGSLPAILIDAWGNGGDVALKNVSLQMADSVWVEGGDVVLGDGNSPALTFATRESALPELAELPESLAKATSTAPGAEAPATVVVSSVTANWLQFRWWIIGGLWLVLSATILWIFEQGRKRASH
jgi:hypothetical protein